MLVWNLIEIPFQVCFNVDAEPNSAYDMFGLCIDLFFISDCIINFHTGFIQDGNYVSDFNQVKWKVSGFEATYETN